MKIENFDEIIKTLPKGSPNLYIVIKPEIYNGYWTLHTTKLPNTLRNLFRKVGLYLNNKYLYWVGFPIVWIVGLKDLVDKYYKKGSLAVLDESSL